LKAVFTLFEGAYYNEQECTSQKFGENELEAKIQDGRQTTSCTL